MNNFYAGETLLLTAWVRDSNNIFSDPDSPPTVTVTDPDGSAVVEDAAMTKTATGKYTYELATTSAFDLGVYGMKVTATLSGDVGIGRHSFLLKA